MELKFSQGIACKWAYNQRGKRTFICATLKIVLDLCQENDSYAILFLPSLVS
jgi:hypothetical protein